MRPIETIVIYLACGAPFAVAFYLRAHTPQQTATNARLILKSLSAALLWPITATALLFLDRSSTNDAERDAQSEKVEQSRRKLFAALDSIVELTREFQSGDQESLQRAAHFVRECVVRYIGLSELTAIARDDAPPAASELELCRLAGRRGKDLELAGRCIHRRNLRRLRAHHERSRRELLHALAELRESAFGSRATTLATPARKSLSEATINFYTLAIELLSTLNDTDATLGVRRLLDSERTRLIHNPETFSKDERALCAQVEASCKPHEQSLALTEGRSNQTQTFTQG